MTRDAVSRAAAGDLVLDIVGLDLVERFPEAREARAYAAEQIAAGGGTLAQRYVGCKRYEGWFQREDHEYGYGPRHGHIIFRVGLEASVRRRGTDARLTDDEILVGLAQLGLLDNGLGDLIRSTDAEYQAHVAQAHREVDALVADDVGANPTATARRARSLRARRDQLTQALGMAAAR
jgi:hypothetical protein